MIKVGVAEIKVPAFSHVYSYLKIKKESTSFIGLASATERPNRESDLSPSVLFLRVE